MYGMGFMQKYKIVVLHLFTLFKKSSIEETLNKKRKVSESKIVSGLVLMLRLYRKGREDVIISYGY